MPPSSEFEAPFLSQLGTSGTRGFYLDTADCQRVAHALQQLPAATLSHFAGSTMNQGFIAREISTIARHGAMDAFPTHLASKLRSSSFTNLPALRFTLAAVELTKSIIRTVPNPGHWQISVPLHSSALGDFRFARRLGRILRQLAPASSLKLMMSPHEPACFLLARDLERSGVNVNFTCVFSVRQALTALLLSNASRISLFVDRINQGLNLNALGEDVTWATQRLLWQHCANLKLATGLIVANVKDWRQVRDLCGCDYFTLSPEILDELLFQTEADRRHWFAGDAFSNCRRPPFRTEKCSEHEFTASTLSSVGGDFIEFLLHLRTNGQLDRLSHGDALFRLFDANGFGNMFYCPTSREWSEMRGSKLPKNHSYLLSRLPADVLFSLLAVVDFQKGEEQVAKDLRDLKF